MGFNFMTICPFTVYLADYQGYTLPTLLYKMYVSHLCYATTGGIFVVTNQLLREVNEQEINSFPLTA